MVLFAERGQGERMHVCQYDYGIALAIIVRRVEDDGPEQLLNAPESRTS